MAWSAADIRRLKDLAERDDLFLSEIAQKMGRTAQSVRWMARKLGIQPPARHRLAHWNKKHAHLRERVMKYYLTHSFDETRAKFGLSQSEMKSLLTVSYRKESLRHLRKDTRTHDKWTTEELLFLLRHAGLQPRDWIARKINRGNARVIKEKLCNLGVNSKTLNGMTLSRYRSVFQCEPKTTIDGNAGPGGGGTPTYFKIVPWVDIERDLACGRIVAPPAFVVITETMARFQRWIHDDNPIKSLRLAAAAGHRPPKINRSYISDRCG